MNLVTFYRLKGGKLEMKRVKAHQHSYATIEGTQPGQRKNKQQRGPTVAELEDKMARDGWSRAKPKVPVALKAAA